MFFDILAFFVVSLISPLFICSTSVHGLPSSLSSSSSSSTTNLDFIDNPPSADLLNSLRLLEDRPVPSDDHDTSANNVEMFMGNSKENDDSSSAEIDMSNEPLNFYAEPSLLNLLSRELLLIPKESQEKRSLPLPSKSHFNFNTASNKHTGSSNADNNADVNDSNDPIRLSSSLKTLVQTNPFARAWLTMLLQKLMQEQSMPYIFKYGRRRRK